VNQALTTRKSRVVRFVVVIGVEVLTIDELKLRQVRVHRVGIGSQVDDLPNLRRAFSGQLRVIVCDVVDRDLRKIGSDAVGESERKNKNRPLVLTVGYAIGST
jgi:hypothetical protein